MTATPCRFLILEILLNVINLSLSLGIGSLYFGLTTLGSPKLGGNWAISVEVCSRQFQYTSNSLIIGGS